MRSFAQIAAVHPTDKDWDHHFGPIYDYVFDHQTRQAAKKVLEIGVFAGVSLRLWEEYFPDAAVIGLDINPSCAQYASERAVVLIGNAGDEQFLRQAVLPLHSDLDVIVDDGSHHVSDQTTSFRVLWDALNPGGWYVVEDLQVSAEGFFGGNPSLDATTASGFFAQQCNWLLAKRERKMRKIVCGPEIVFMQKA